MTSAFLQTAGWHDAKAFPLQADFSSRRFTRLQRPDGARAILMEANPDQKTPQFVLISGLLRTAGLSAPEIYATQPEHGLVLMEDFGDTTFGALLDKGHDRLSLYRRATDVLVKLHQGVHATTPPSLPLFNAELFTAQAELFLDNFFPKALGRESTTEERASFRAAWLSVLKPLDSLPQTLMLRDFMPDNLMDLPNRAGAKNVGLVDFQDGGIGPVAYDLASLCEKVRRDDGDEIFEDVLAHYTQAHPVLSLSDLRRACHILSAQRHMRILGILAKPTPARRDVKSYEKRVSAYLTHLLKKEELCAVYTWAQTFIKPIFENS